MNGKEIIIAPTNAKYMLVENCLVISIDCKSMGMSFAHILPLRPIELVSLQNS